VAANGPSARAGIDPGDFIVRINGESLQHTDDLDVLTFIAERRPGERLRFDIIRKGTPRVVVVTVGVMPESGRAGWNAALQNARRARLQAQTRR
jgi:serine protease Do